MGRGLCTAVAAGLMTVATAFAAAGAETASPPPEAVKRYNALVDDYRSGRCDALLAHMAQLAGSPDFAALDRASQSTALGISAVCALELDKDEVAYGYLAKATAYPESLGWIFRDRFTTAVALHRPADAVAALEVAARARPKALGALEPDAFLPFLGELAKAGDKASRARIFAALAQADYRPDDPFLTAGEIWLEQASDLAEAGDATGSADALGRIDDAMILAQAQVDRRFVAILDADPQRFDVRAAAERQLDRDQTAMLHYPERLEGVWRVAGELRQLGHASDALTLIDAAAPRIRRQARALVRQADGFPVKDNAADGPDQYIDLIQMQGRVSNERAWALADLGRTDEAVAGLKQDLGVDSGRWATLSQTLNLSYLLRRSGKPQDALDAVNRADRQGFEITPYARMLQTELRACALADLDRRDDLRRELAYARAHEADFWPVAFIAPLCAGDLDAAASAVVRALADPSDVRAVLFELAEFDPPAGETPVGRRMHDRLQALVRRPDVQAAVAKVGRLPHFHLVVDAD